MQLFNKGSRKIDSLKSQESGIFTEEQGKKLLALYPDEIVLVGSEHPAVVSTDSEINEYVSQLESEKSALEQEITEFKAEIEKLKAGDKKQGKK